MSSRRKNSMSGAVSKKPTGSGEAAMDVEPIDAPTSGEASPSLPVIPVASADVLKELESQFAKIAQEAVDEFVASGKSSRSAGAGGVREQKDLLSSVLETLRLAAFGEAKKHVVVDSARAAESTAKRRLAADPFLHPAEAGIDVPGETEALALQQPIDQELARKVVALEREHAALVKEVKLARGQGATQALEAVSSAYEGRLKRATETAAPMLTRAARALQSVGGQRAFPLSDKNAESQGVDLPSGGATTGRAATGGRRQSRGSAAAALARAAAYEESLPGKISLLLEAREPTAANAEAELQSSSASSDDEGGAGGAASKGAKVAKKGKKRGASASSSSSSAGRIGLSRKQAAAEDQAAESRKAGFVAAVEEMEDVALAYKDQKPRMKAALKVAKDTAMVLDELQRKGPANAVHEAVLQATK